MEQGIQSNFPDKTLREYGCYFFCLLEWAEREGCGPIGYDRAVYLFNAAKYKRLVNSEALILHPPGVLNLMLGEGKYSTLDITQVYPAAYDKYIICLTKPKYTHFILFDHGETWDPLNPKRPSAKDYDIDGYRVIT